MRRGEMRRMATAQWRGEEWVWFESREGWGQGKLI
jgi:hypothetical protein